ncbi:MAG: carboxypeptidase-like regulatory domain-containing protein [Planctomycetia bacterium]|jgi:hypothetical protein
MQWKHWALITLVVSGMTGCGEAPKDLPTVPIHPVKGTVTLDGKPIAGARVSLQAVQGAKPGDINPNAVTDESGAFQLSTYAPLDGAPEGAYSVTVSWPVVINASGSDPEYGKERLPLRYQVPDKSGLVITVSEELQDTVLLELTSK